MTKEMNKDIFSKHLDQTIEEIVQKSGIHSEEFMFRITPVYEQGKVLNGKDEVMRLNILNKKQIDGRLFSKQEMVSMLTFFSPLVSIWIDVEMFSDDKEKTVFDIKCSLRLRKPSLLRHQESGHPPFKAILKI